MTEGCWFCLQCGAEVPKERINTERKGICPSCKKNVYFIASNPTSFDAETKYKIEKQRKEEEYVQKRWKEQESAGKKFKPEKELIDILKDSSLLVNTIKEIQEAEGIAGEEDTILAGIIVANTRLVKNASAESKNLFYSDTTGIGKDRVTKAIKDVLVPKEANLHVTKMTPEAFTYWHANEPEWTWDDKVIHFEDITQKILNCSTFKVMASGGSKAVVVKDQKTIEIPIEGKPVMILTSHHANPIDENLRRFPIGGLDKSLEQTRRIKSKISEKYSGRKKIQPNIALRRALYSLKTFEVVIPYAELIQHFFPEDMIMRTHYDRFLSYICSSAVFHQHQRERNGDGALIAEPDDYMIARTVLIYTTSNPKMIPTSREYREILAILRENIIPMSINEILYDERCKKSKDWLYKNLHKLMETGLIIRDERIEEAGAVIRGVTTYQYAQGLNARVIPKWEELGRKICNLVFNEIDDTSLSNEEKNFLEWFSENDISIAVDEEGKYYVVLFEQIIPIYREDLLVFEVLLAFFNKRNKERYKKYDIADKLEGGSLSLSSKIRKLGGDEDVEYYDSSNIQW